MKPRVIAIDDDEMFLTATKTLFAEKKVPLNTFSDSSKAIREIRRAKVDKTPYRMAIVDFDMPTKGHEVVRAIKQIDPSIHTVILSASITKEESKLCTMSSADHIYLKQKSKNVTLMLAEIASLKVKHSKLTNEEKMANSERIEQVLEIKGCSSSLAKVASQVEMFGKAGESVLITGQSGVGKEPVAKAIHKNSKRSGAFIAVNCGAISKEMFKSELFGHKKGSFTGAMTNNAGKFMAANFGTIFLDEIGEMPLDIQVMLLRVLQEGEIETVGTNTPQKVDVRIVAATNRDLQEEVKKGHFREDLYYRLNILPIVVPPLSERSDDIEPIAQFFVDQKNMEQRQNKTISREAMDFLTSQVWQGNVRELEGAVKKAYALSSDQIEKETFSKRANNDHSSTITQIQSPEDFPTYKEFKENILKHLERTYLEKAMILANGNRPDAAKLAGLNYTTYVDKRNKRGLSSKQAN
jgi:DNA-binding NtrC family response regulator